MLATMAMSGMAISIAFHWAPDVLAQTMRHEYGWGVAVFLPLVVWEAARAALPFWLAARVESRLTAMWFPAALAAVLLESVMPSVFPWRFGDMQVGWPIAIQSVDLFGAEWATVMEFAHAGALIGVGAALIEMVRFRSIAVPLRGLGRSAPLWLCIANLTYGALAMSYWKEQMQTSAKVRVALVQVDPTYVGSTDKLVRLTESVRGAVDLVCWPESSGGHYDAQLDRLSDPELVYKLSRAPLRGLRPWPKPSCPLLLGSEIFSGDWRHPDQIYQSAILLDTREQIVGRYDKRLLMPFGEYVPAKDWAPFLERLFPLHEEISRGTEALVLRASGRVRLGVMICYEDMHPETARSLVRNSANLLVALANGASFGSTLTLRQHRLLAQLRAVECRRFLVRAASTGETCVITPLGRVQARLPLQTTDVLTADVALLEGQTLACRLGDALSWACGLLLLLYLHRWSAKRRSKYLQIV